MLSSPPRLDIEDQQVYFTSSEDLAFLPEGAADFIVTSPPYWNLKDYGHPDQIGGEDFEAYLARLNKVWDACYRASKDDAVMIVNVGNRRHKKRFYPLALQVAQAIEGWTLWDMLIWYIPNALPQPNYYIERLFDNKYEFLLVFTKNHGQLDYTFHKPRVPQKYRTADPRAHKKNKKGRCIGNIIRIPAYRPPNIREMGYHVAAYPEELVALLLESFTDPGDVVLDPFLGSGTTLKVARTMRRKGIGIELNRDYEPLIERRVAEPWEVPDWKDLDILHSATMETGTQKPRKVHHTRQETHNGKGGGDDLDVEKGQANLF